MKKTSFITFLSVFAVSGLIFNGFVLGGTAQAQTISGNFSAQAIVDSTNAERARQNLPALKVNTTLNSSAQIKAEDMLRNEYFEHQSPNGTDMTDLMKQVGYNFLGIGENLAMGNFRDSQDIVAAWMNSSGHRENIMNPNYTEIGVSIISGNYQGRQILMAVQHFGRPMSAGNNGYRPAQPQGSGRPIPQQGNRNPFQNPFGNPFANQGGRRMPPMQFNPFQGGQFGQPTNGGQRGCPRSQGNSQFSPFQGQMNPFGGQQMNGRGNQGGFPFGGQQMNQGNPFMERNGGNSPWWMGQVGFRS